MITLLEPPYYWNFSFSHAKTNFYDGTTTRVLVNRPECYKVAFQKLLYIEIKGYAKRIFLSILYSVGFPTYGFS